MPRSSWARAPKLLGLHSRAQELRLLGPMHLEPVLLSGRGHRGERPARRAGEWPLLATAEGRPARSDGDPTQPKIKI